VDPNHWKEIEVSQHYGLLLNGEYAAREAEFTALIVIGTG